MQREERDFNGEGHKKRQEEQHLLARGKRELTARQHIENGGVAERMGAVVEIDDRRQHQYGAGHGVQKELHGGVDAALMSPDADQEIYGHEGNFPEHIKQKQVLGQKDSDESELKQQQEGVEFLHSTLDG